ncbi:hypothetical protein GA0074704_5505 [Micromonospora siamensis]|uniref:Uncharacterized protein n=1 Tax=Micromonospora siamensis TaxID=299152 RepID=A0A1C5K4L0_9ACTN|nr:hypothetical protein GA0074704_5505 [Micromonospora siamensis]
MKAHRTDVVSLGFGLVFLALSAWWLLAQLLGLALPPIGWFLAGGLLLVGVLGLVGALRSARPDPAVPAGEQGWPAAPAAAEQVWPTSSAAAEQGWSGGEVPPVDPAAAAWGNPDAGRPADDEGPTAELSPERPDADEWRTEASTDEPRTAVEDRVADEPAGPPGRSDPAPPADPTDPPFPRSGRDG